MKKEKRIIKRPIYFPAYNHRIRHGHHQRGPKVDPAVEACIDLESTSTNSNGTASDDDSSTS
ncbi:MAG: hypothetical protein ABSA13_14805 [Beijerinckiaceae bacterium]|jgi:hypothetical protein